MDCGPACIAMAASHYGKSISLQHLREWASISKDGVSLQGISEAAQKAGFNTRKAKLSSYQLKREILPCVLHWNQNHFVVLYHISYNNLKRKFSYKIVDPAYGFINYSEDDLKRNWIADNGMGIALFLQPSDAFDKNEFHKAYAPRLNSVFHYLTPYKSKLVLAFFLLLISTCINFTLPYLTKQLIDVGIGKGDINFISLILLSQLVLFTSSIIIDIFRNWIALFLGRKISIGMISGFLRKILKLPIHFFETKRLGDFNQRIQDHERIETFLSSQALLTFFSFISFIGFFVVLFNFNKYIVLIYLAFTAVSVAWGIYWLRKVRNIDHLRFHWKSENQNEIYEIITGASEIKLNNLSDYKTLKWNKIQENLFDANRKMMKTNQFQSSGFEFINQIKNILVTFYASLLVVKGDMTLGALLSISYIIGQLNSPLNQIITFFRSLQNAKLSLSRLNDIHEYDEEERNTDVAMPEYDTGIQISNLYFKYNGSSQFVLKNINLVLPKGQVTAIVGASGCGKTTLLKLILKFYSTYSGEITFGNRELKNISASGLRKRCGTVLQDGFLFSDTILKNIITDDAIPDEDRLSDAIRTAHLEEFLSRFPMGIHTKIGNSGMSLSGGQKQRILIARAVYKQPEFLFFDEATSHLDAKSENIIHTNLLKIFKNRTVLVIAHRLSTVKDADQIVVLKNGEVFEIGTHSNLVAKGGEYYHLVKNQLQLDSAVSNINS